MSPIFYKIKKRVYFYFFMVTQMISLPKDFTEYNRPNVQRLDTNAPPMSTKRQTENALAVFTLREVCLGERLLTVAMVLEQGFLKSTVSR